MHLTPFGAVDAYAFRIPLRVLDFSLSALQPYSLSAVAGRKSKFMTIFLLYFSIF